jgi:hypothetical protein
MARGLGHPRRCLDALACAYGGNGGKAGGARASYRARVWLSQRCSHVLWTAGNGRSGRHAQLRLLDSALPLRPHRGWYAGQAALAHAQLLRVDAVMLPWLCASGGASHSSIAQLRSWLVSTLLFLARSLRGRCKCQLDMTRRPRAARRGAAILVAVRGGPDGRVCLSPPRELPASPQRGVCMAVTCGCLV